MPEHWLAYLPAKRKEEEEKRPLLISSTHLSSLAHVSGSEQIRWCDLSLRPPPQCFPIKYCELELTKLPWPSPLKKITQPGQTQRCLEIQRELENNPHQLPNNDMGFLKHPESNQKESWRRDVCSYVLLNLMFSRRQVRKPRRHSHGRTRAKYEWGEDIAKAVLGKKDTECEIHVCGWIGGMSYVRRCMPCLFWIYTHTSIHFHGSVL